MKQIRQSFLICMSVLAGCSDSSFFGAPHNQNEGAIGRPNILVIVADDLGYTDLGFMGGEIATPNLDTLAGKGQVLTSFYAAPTCSPARAMLMSGTDNHLAGLGTMYEAIAPNQKGMPGYEGYLNDDVLPLPRILRDAGYHTFMTGKWHLGYERKHSPAARGFSRSFALLAGAGSHLNLSSLDRDVDESYREDGEYVTEQPEGFYSTRFFTERMIEYIGSREDDEPFFGYLAYTAPHWPLQVPDADLDRNRGAYDEGYDVLRSDRLKKAKALGIVAEDVPLPESLPSVVPWNHLSREQQQHAARQMEIYATMVEIMDAEIGKLINSLNEADELDNTAIFFLSDNGAEGTPLEVMLSAEWLDSFSNSTEDLGTENSFSGYGNGWAQASMAPFKFWKMHLTEGGVRVPAFVWAGKTMAGQHRIRAGRNAAVVTVMDLAPTILDLASVPHPGNSYKGKEILPMRGKSMIPLLAQETESVHGNEPLGAELFDGRSLRKGAWKAVWDIAPGLQGSGGPWQLYNIEEDPAESNDLASQYPDKLAELTSDWDRYARETGVIRPQFAH